MTLFYECTDEYAQKVLDTADIVRDAIFRQYQHHYRRAAVFPVVNAALLPTVVKVENQVTGAASRSKDL
jgi:hypothetical protein